MLQGVFPSCLGGYKDNNGNITAVTENGQTTNYTYDALNRLTGIQRPDGEQISYQYDARGNRNLASVNDKSLDGFIPGELSYNNWERLAAFTTGGTAYNYSYDPEGLRNKKVTPSGTTRYHYDNEDRVIAESNSSGNVTAETIWGDKALARKVSGNYYYYLYNGHGDVTKVIDQNGNIVNSYTYDEWGNILSKQELLPQPLKYAGEYYDDESGLYYLRARYYDPTIGRFISEDAYEGEITNPLSLNLYTYVANNPLIYIDPSGNYLIGLREWINQVGGSIYWDPKTRIATAAYNHHVNQYYIDDYTVINDHIMVDLEQLLKDFNYEPKEKSLETVSIWDDPFFIAASMFSGSGEIRLVKKGVDLTAKGTGNLGKGFYSFNALKKKLGSPGEGNAWHHIVEQSQIVKSGFKPNQIHNTENIIAVDKATHAKISGYYSSKQRFTGGQTVRDWLAGQNYEKQYEFGMKVLRDFGVIK